MTETSRTRLTLLLHFLCTSVIRLVSSHAFPANPQSPPSLPSLSLQNQNFLSITQNIQNLVNILAADESFAYSHSTMLSCELAVEFYEHGEGPHDLYHSSNISHFRDTKCVFRYGGEIIDERFSRFVVQNKFPEWNQWALPAPYIVQKPEHLWDTLPFAWSEVETLMSVERADQLLKADGHEPAEQWIGQYDMVYLTKRTAHDLGWCFVHVIGDYPDTSASHNYLVLVHTGKVEQTIFC